MFQCSSVPVFQGFRVPTSLIATYLGEVAIILEYDAVIDKRRTDILLRAENHISGAIGDDSPEVR